MSSTSTLVPSQSVTEEVERSLEEKIRQYENRNARILMENVRLRKELDDKTKQLEMAQAESRRETGVLQEANREHIEQLTQHLSETVTRLKKEVEQKNEEIQNMEVIIKEIAEGMENRKKDAQEGLHKLIVKLWKPTEESDRKLQEVRKSAVCIRRLPSFEGCWTTTPSSINRLYISVTKPMYLCALGVHCCRSKTDAKYTVNITGPNNVATSVVGPAWNDGEFYATVNLETPLQMNPGGKYLLDWSVDKQVAMYAGNFGNSDCVLPGHPVYGVKITRCDGSETTVEKGQFPYFHFAAIER